VERPSRYTAAAVSGVLFVVVLLVGLYVAPDLVYPEEQVGGVSGSFYVNYESRLLAQAVLFGVASVLFLFFLGGLRARSRGWLRSCWPPGRCLPASGCCRQPL
jgi:ABC-type spermidine/putrescine transport system permease subunit I